MRLHRPAALAVFIAAVLQLVVAPARPAGAQVRDTTRVDTLAIDTTAIAQDSLRPPPLLVEMPGSDTVGGYASGVWIWSREDLLDLQAVSLADLLARIPGIAVFRAGVYLQPEAASIYGGGPERMRVEINGFVIDPLLTALPDLSMIALADLYEVRVERRADILLVRLRTEASRDARAYSRIEAGVGEPKANVFRGILLAPNFITGPLALAVERVELQGSGRPQPADAFAGWLRWGWLSERRGVEVELRSDAINREPESPRPEEIRRQDLVLRGRNRFGEDFVAEAYVGRASLRRDEIDPGVADSLLGHADRSVTQVGLRAGYRRGRSAAEAALRWRDYAALPRLEVDLSADVRAGPIDLRLNSTHQSWKDATAATSWGVRASASLATDLRVFAEYAGGERGAAPLFLDSVLESPRVFGRTTYRGGVEASRWGITAGGAALRVESDGVATFGFPGDSSVTEMPGGSVTGWEATIRVPLIGDWLSAAGSYSTWVTGTRWVYMPASLGSGGLLLDALPLESDNLEFIGRLELGWRGPMLAPPAVAGDPAIGLPARNIINAAIEIRIIDVRIFARFDDMAGQDIEDLPGLPIRGPRILYGVKWHFWN